MSLLQVLCTLTCWWSWCCIFLNHLYSYSKPPGSQVTHYPKIEMYYSLHSNAHLNHWDNCTLYWEVCVCALVLLGLTSTHIDSSQSRSTSNLGQEVGWEAGGRLTCAYLGLTCITLTCWVAYNAHKFCTPTQGRACSLLSYNLSGCKLMLLYPVTRDGGMAVRLMSPCCIVFWEWGEIWQACFDNQLETFNLNQIMN